MDDVVISIETRKYSTVIRRILLAYKLNSVVTINGDTYFGEGIDRMMDGWCTNRSITGTFIFEVTREGRPLFGFTDHPEELWAALSEEHYVRGLAEDRLLRYRILPVQRSWGGPGSLFGQIKKLLRSFRRTKVEQAGAQNP